MDEKITDKDRRNPGDVGQNTALGGMPLAVGKKSIVEQIGKTDEKKRQQVFFGPPEGLDTPQKNEKIHRRIQKKAISLVEKIIQEGIDPEHDRNFHDHFPEGLDSFGRQHPLVDGHRIECAVQFLGVEGKKNNRDHGKSQKGKYLPPGHVIFQQEIGRNQNQRPQNHVVFQPEPGKQGEQKTEEYIVNQGQSFCRTDLPEYVQRKEGDRYFGVKMNGIKNRVVTTGWTESDYSYLNIVNHLNKDKFIKTLYNEFKDNSKVKWKDSIKKVLGLPEERCVG